LSDKVFMNGIGQKACGDSVRRVENAKGLDFSMVPEAGIEPARTCGPLDFESSASTNFTTPAPENTQIIGVVRLPCQYDIDMGKRRC
jgi:hypothetical protein